MFKGTRWCDHFILLLSFVARPHTNPQREISCRHPEACQRDLGQGRERTPQTVKAKPRLPLAAKGGLSKDPWISKVEMEMEAEEQVDGRVWHQALGVREALREGRGFLGWWKRLGAGGVRGGPGQEWR